MPSPIAGPYKPPLGRTWTTLVPLNALEEGSTFDSAVISPPPFHDEMEEEQPVNSSSIPKVSKKNYKQTLYTLVSF